MWFLSHHIDMKLRLDLLEYVTAEDISEEAEANVHRYSKEPVFSKTGKGFLRPETPEERQASIQRSEKFTQRLKERKQRAESLELHRSGSPCGGVD